MTTYKVTTPDGQTVTRNATSRAYPYAVLGLPAPYETDEGTVQPRWHANFASSMDKAEREARIQRSYGNETRIVETEETP